MSRTLQNETHRKDACFLQNSNSNNILFVYSTNENNKKIQQKKNDALPAKSGEGKPNICELITISERKVNISLKVQCQQG